MKINYRISGKITILLLMLSAVTLSGQQGVFMRLSSPAAERIQEAAAGGFYVVRATYALRSTESGRRYGRGGQSYYGQGYGVALAGDGHLWMPADVLEPWVGEASLATLSDSLQAELSGLEVRSLTDSTFTSIDVIPKDSLLTDSLLLVAMALPEGKGSFEIWRGAPKEGYSIYLKGDEGASLSDSSDTELVLLWTGVGQRQPLLEAAYEPTKLTTDPDLLDGGFFILETGLGTIRLYLFGFQTYAEAWKVLPIHQGEQEEGATTNEGGADLTPIPDAEPGVANQAQEEEEGEEEEGRRKKRKKKKRNNNNNSNQ